MAIIPQKDLFAWQQIEALGDLERLVLVIDTMPDEALMRTLECERGRGRNDYPVRAVWNSILAAVVFQHVSIESLRRDLQRNAQLRQVCGFDVTRGERAVPPPHVYTRFLRSVIEHRDLIDAMFGDLVKALREVLPGFCETMAIDSKAISSHARSGKKDAPEQERDGRRDIDADWGKKTYRGRREDGTAWQTVTSWFGYKLHLIVDAEYELPVAYSVTRASTTDITQAHEMIDEIEEGRPELLDGCETFLGDKAYDDTKLVSGLFDDHAVKPVIDIRNMWKDGEDTKLADGTRNVVYDAKGNVSCCCMKTGKLRPMSFGGFDKDRDALKYRCPRVYQHVTCEGHDRCPVNNCVRIKLSQDRRIFTPTARSSYKWKRIYAKRTAVERVNSRLDVSFGFERHYIRGLKKMEFRCGLALVVMLAMALGRVRQNRRDLMRSLVRVAA